MIRRAFWLTLGAVLGVAGYRRLAALGRGVSPALRVRELTRFAADVREGMALYSARHSAPPGPTLSNNGGRGRGPLPGPGHRTNDERDGADGVG